MPPKRRKPSNPLALAVLAFLAERSMHPYEIAQLLRQRGKEHSIKINFGSLYTVVQNLEKHGFVAAAGVQKQGNRPERTVYAITDAGREEMHDWLTEIVAVPRREYAHFEAALSLISVLPPDEAVEALQTRLARQEVAAAGLRGALAKLYETLPRVFVIETEYQAHMLEAEAAWLRGVLPELTDGSLGGVEDWRAWHRTGEVPAEWQNLEEELPGGEGGTPGAAQETYDAHEGP
ncbi:PadR family transcriptional regulator [Streptomyces sp. WMMC500]|uniref:PadR family transcriptional regulator n=1 Tax=Streptomyces sp. WMMC500 TaxID=3015154 RepID=UPI00248C6A96|nr:PadR family transcriptional regulator [Streptomyces sp. WMMC500]WBB60348.1 PadR family transcriptional regulator [Streptomyces sp. WMMC500]